MTEGSPRTLIESIDAIVVEIEASEVRAARHALDGQAFVKSVAQLGTRLHALLDPSVADAVERVNGLLRAKAVEANVEIVRASLEDVFVAATGFNVDRAAPAAA